MTGDFIFRLILGHLVGDYLLQNDWMALNKKKSFWHCFWHCFAYTGSIIFFTYPENRTCLLFPDMEVLSRVFFAFLIFMSHFVLDYTNIVDRYLHMIRGRSWGALFDRFGCGEVTFRDRKSVV